MRHPEQKATAHMKNPKMSKTKTDSHSQTSNENRHNVRIGSKIEPTTHPRERRKVHTLNIHSQTTRKELPTSRKIFERNDGPTRRAPRHQENAGNPEQNKRIRETQQEFTDAPHQELHLIPPQLVAQSTPKHKKKHVDKTKTTKPRTTQHIGTQRQNQKI